MLNGSLWIASRNCAVRCHASSEKPVIWRRPLSGSGGLGGAFVLLSPLAYSGEESCLETWALDNRWVPTEGGRDLRDNVFGAAVSAHTPLHSTYIHRRSHRR